MLKSFFLFSVLSIAFSCKAQISGVWQGLLQKDGQTLDQASIIYFEFSPNGNYVARTREEIATKDGFAVKKVKGKIEKNHAELEQVVIEKKKDLSGVRWCNMKFVIDFIDSTGYLQGKFSSSECRGVTGKIFAYRSTQKVTSEPTVKELQSWRPIFIDDLKKGRKAPEIRDLERKNFQFHPIYFDYDKVEIKEEYKAFLNNMAKVVLSHTDLRIKVVGHTDADGSEAYNIDLSERRAQAIITYFVGLGLARDRIQIEFKGESEPIADNKTEDGKQLNRRVDFSFI